MPPIAAKFRGAKLPRQLRGSKRKSNYRNGGRK